VKRAMALVMVMLAASASGAGVAGASSRNVAQSLTRVGEGQKPQWAPTRNFSGLNTRAVFAIESRKLAGPYAGERVETATGLGVARYYDSKLGVFLSRDSFEGSVNDSPSLHRYTYAHNQPLKHRDPTGRCIDLVDMKFSGSMCMASAKVLSGALFGGAKAIATGAAGIGFLAYNVTGAALHSMTGNSAYEAQADAFNEGLQGAIDAVSSPVATAEKLAAGVKDRAESVISKAEQGDYFGAGETTGELTVEAVTAIEGAVAVAKVAGKVAQKGAAALGRSTATAGAELEASGAATIVEGDAVSTRQVQRTCKGGVSCGRPDECFVAGTLVLTPDGLKPIEEFKPGELVWARDASTDAAGWKPVLRTFKTLGKRVLALVVEGADGRSEEFQVTGGHPFWVKDQGWRRAEDLNQGDILVAASGAWLRLSAATWLQSTATVFNLEVADWHTYFVGESSVFVHNMCGKTGPIEGSPGEPGPNCGTSCPIDTLVDAAKPSSRLSPPIQPPGAAKGPNFDKARREGFEKAGMTDPANVVFSKVDPKTGTVVEFKGAGGAKVGYDGPHPNSPGPYHDQQHISVQSAGKRGAGGAVRENIPYSGPQHPSRPDVKE